MRVERKKSSREPSFAMRLKSRGNAYTPAKYMMVRKGLTAQMRDETPDEGRDNDKDEVRSDSHTSKT